MVNWNSEAEIIRDAVFFNKFMHALLGLYIWEWFSSLGFDWLYISGQRPFKWPLIFYFLNRYCLLFALIGIAIALNVTAEIDCQGLYTFNQCFGNAAIGLASINLCLRTMAIWSQSWFIVAPLIVVIMGHWSLLLHGILLSAAWVPGQGCVITHTDSRMLAVTFVYTMAFDLTVLLLTAYKLIFNAPSTKMLGRSQLVNLIFGDGLIYFIVAFVANLIATVFMVMNLNPVMSIIANVPAAIASSIVACRAVRRLSKYTSQGPEVYNTGGTQASTLAFRTNTTLGGVKRPKITTTNISCPPGFENEGVHVQMETFESPSTAVSDSPYMDYDAMGNVLKIDGKTSSHKHIDPYENDSEAQEIRDEFKRPPY